MTTVDLLADALGEVRAELARVDGKAGALLGLSAAAAALLAARTTGAALPVAVAVVTWGAGAALAAAVVVLLVTVGPRLRPAGRARSRSRTSWVAYADSPDLAAHVRELAAAGPVQWRIERLAELSAIVAHKYRRLRLAVALLVAAVVLLVAAHCLLAVTR